MSKIGQNSIKKGRFLPLSYHLLLIFSARDDLVKVSWKSDARKCQNQLTPPYFDQLSERHQPLCLWVWDIYPTPPFLKFIARSFLMSFQLNEETCSGARSARLGQLLVAKQQGCLRSVCKGGQSGPILHLQDNPSAYWVQWSPLNAYKIYCPRSNLWPFNT